MTELLWHPAAAREAQAARRWYRIEQDAPAVARRFQSMLLRALTEISRAPERWPVLVDELRNVRFEAFRTGSSTISAEDHVLIVAVMHERQRPNYWRDRV